LDAVFIFIMSRSSSSLYPAFLAMLILLQQGCGMKTAGVVATIPAAETAAPAEADADQIAEAQAPSDPDPESAAEIAAAASPQSAARTLKEIFPESHLAAPIQDFAGAATKYDTRVFSRDLGAPLALAWQYREDPHGMIVGFDFSNRGGNRILPERYNIDKNLFFTRDFQFRFDDRARQDIYLSVTDWAASRDRQFRLSELMNTVMHFFPRKYVPAIAVAGGRSIVTLPTGEQVEFDAETHEVVGGAFAEAPVDLNPDRAKRRFAAVDYVGTGLVVRADARGSDPRLGASATIAVSEPGCAGEGCKKVCRVASTELWDQKGAVRFKFATDEEFDRYLQSRCGFGIPRSADETVAALH
jgi:hypothetical protein